MNRLAIKILSAVIRWPMPLGEVIMLSLTRQRNPSWWDRVRLKLDVWLKRQEEIEDTE